MEHLGTKSLETERLILRPFVLQDGQAMFDNWASDPEVTKFLTWKAHEDVDVTDSTLMEWISQYGRKDFYMWAITAKENGTAPIGSISVVEKDDSLSLVHIGYCIGRKWWNRGITSEALGAVIDYLFREVGVNRIESRHDPRNANSGRVMLKCGMRYEGTMRQADKNNQGICDAAFYGILKEDTMG